MDEVYKLSIQKLLVLWTLFVSLLIAFVWLMNEVDKPATRCREDVEYQASLSVAGFIGFVCGGDMSAWMEEVRFDQPTQTTPTLDLTNSAEIVRLATSANYLF